MLVAAVAGGLLGIGGAAAAASHLRGYYVSVGDSYAVGYQPGKGATTGYSGYVARTRKLTLKNFGCGGATTTSILETVGCAPPFGPTAKSGAVAYPTTTQIAAADAFITAHRGHVALITVSISGNDVTACAQTANPATCVAGVVGTIKTNVAELAGDLRTAAGPAVPIVGLTYPDVILGQWVHPPISQSLATQSVTAFQALINPTLKTAYATAGASFVDVTAGTGAYIPLTTTVRLKPYGTIPSAVAKVCQLTYYCALGNIHANTVGYALIGKLIVASLKA